MNKRVNKTFTNSNPNLKENHNPSSNTDHPLSGALATPGNIARKDSSKLGAG
jgi:hypothetical protein